jgi:glycerate 2-kinase
LSVARHLKRTGRLLSIGRKHLDLERFKRIFVLGAGKATSAMAASVESLGAGMVSRGIIIVKDGHCQPLKSIEQIEASHPIPDVRGLAGTERIMALARDADAETLVVCLLSGGASSLLVAPADGLTLKDLIVANELLLTSGVDINDTNTVRKHLSRIKGGRLAVLAQPATVLSLIVSDVIGDRLDVIASGPTVPDPTTFGEALAIITSFGLLQWMPRAVVEHLKRGAGGGIPETPKGTEPAFEATSNQVICSNHLAMTVALSRARELGLEAEILDSVLKGEARAVARSLAAIALSRQKTLGTPGGKTVCLLAGGETTVTVRGKGAGGRNQELALAFALEVAGNPGITCLSAGTDGTDGPTDATGAIVDGNTIPLAFSTGLNPLVHLENNDSYGFFERLSLASAEAACHLKTGPTGTNVMDLGMIAISPNGVGRGND